MPLIERYIFARTARLFLLVLGALVGTLWVTQVLRELDVVTAKGQAIWTFLLMTVLALPALIQLVAPIAFLAAAIVTLNALNSDGEMPVISAAGASRAAVSRPILLLAVAVTLVTAFSHHVVAPASLAAFRVILTHVRADVIAVLVQDGGFRSVDSGLTMHIREKAGDGTFRGIFISDEREKGESVQYSAASGLLLERPSGSFLVLQDGDLIRQRPDGETNIVDFQTYAFDLGTVGGTSAEAFYQARERSTLYLLNPPPDDPLLRDQARRVIAEIHNRTTAPLYALAFAFVALAGLGRPRSGRQDRSIAMVVVVLACLALRTAGFAAAALARNVPIGVALMYAVPLGGIAIGLVALLLDRAPRLRRRIGTPAAALAATPA